MAAMKEQQGEPQQTIYNLGQWKRQFFVHEAKRWLGVHETPGSQPSQLVNLFRGWNADIPRSAWCMAFVHYCLQQTDLLFDHCLQKSDATTRHGIFDTQHVMTAWEKTPERFRSETPQPGMLVLWQWYDDNEPTSSGHAGIIVGHSEQTDRLITVEGNTSLISPSGSGQRGVAQKCRRWNCTQGALRVKGFLDPWAGLDQLFSMHLSQELKRRACCKRSVSNDLARLRRETQSVRSIQWMLRPEAEASSCSEPKEIVKNRSVLEVHEDSKEIFNAAKALLQGLFAVGLT